MKLLDKGDAELFREAAEEAAKHITQVIKRKTARTDFFDDCVMAAKMFLAAKASDNNAAQIAFMAQRAVPQLPKPEES